MIPDDLAKQALQAAARRLYKAFAHYADAGSDFCSHCYEAEQVRRITSTSPEALDAEDTRTLLWEAADHWQNSVVYRHYLPRMLESLAPPASVEPIYPEHPFETMTALGFAGWPEAEKAAVVQYLELATPNLTFLSEFEVREWQLAFAKLRSA